MAFLISLCTLFLYPNQQDSISFEGKWENTRNKISYEFKSNGKVIFEQNGIPVYVNEVTFEAGDPIKARFTLKQGNMTLIIPALIKVIDEETIWIEQFAPGENPTEFSQRDHMKHVLKKTK